MSGLLFDPEDGGGMFGLLLTEYAAFIRKMDPCETGCEDGPGSVLCPVAKFGISHVQSSVSVAILVVIIDKVFVHPRHPFGH
jgi:hypothetical protein